MADYYISYKQMVDGVVASYKDAEGREIVGELSDLTTSDTDSIVDAINSIITERGALTDLTTTDTDSIVDAINELDSDMGDLSDLDTTDKSNLVAAINEALIKGGVYKSSSYYELDDTGTTDCATILNSASDNVGFKAGTYLIDSDCTIDAQCVFAEGAILQISSGVTLTINGQILAGRYRIFDNSGTIVVDESLQDFGYPEWFDDDIVACYEVFRHIKLAYKTYTLTSNLWLDRPNTCIEGVSYPTNWTENCSILYFSGDYRLVLGTATSTTVNDFPRNITVKNVFIRGSSTGDMISIYGVVRPILEGVYIYTSTALCGITFYRSIGGSFDKIYVQSVGISGTFYAYRFYDISSSGVVGARSASNWLRNCTYGDTNAADGNTYGFFIDNYQSDIFIDNCEVAAANIGLAVATLTEDYCVDILINNCDFDSCRTQCITLYQCEAGMVSINNCYCALASTSSGAAVQIYSPETSDFMTIINNCQLLTTASTQIAIQCIQQTKALLNNIAIQGIGTSYSSTDDTYIKALYLDNGVPTEI